MRFPSHLLSIASVLSGAALVVACSSGDGATGVTFSGPIPLDQYCADYATAVCNPIESCCASSGIPVDDARCRSQAITSCQNQVASYQSKGRLYNANAASECLSSYGTLFDGCYARPSSDPFVKASSEACARVWTGAAALGATCTSASDCAPPASGEVECRYGGTAGSTCALRAKVGDTCGSSSGSTSYVNCETGLTCKYQSGSTPAKYVCTARASAGAACDPVDYRSCIDGLACDPTTKICGNPPAVGSKCMGSGTSACAAPGYCDTKTMICAAPGGVGAVCVPYSTPSQCNTGLTCDSVAKTCVALKADGEACTSSTQCLSTRCSSGKCSRPVLVSPATCSALGTGTGTGTPTPGG